MNKQNSSLKVDVDLLRHVASLARLEFPEEEQNEYAQNLSKLLGYVEILSTAQVAGIEPLFHPSEAGLMSGAKIQTASSMLNQNVLHQDEPRSSLPVSDVLFNAPDQAENQFKINAVIDEQ